VVLSSRVSPSVENATTGSRDGRVARNLLTLKFKFLRIANRLTGISTPVFGASWKPPELDVDVANETHHVP
jgi:hypothetical protein